MTRVTIETSLLLFNLNEFDADDDDEQEDVDDDGHAHHHEFLLDDDHVEID